MVAMRSLLPAVAVLVLPGTDDGGPAMGAHDATTLALTAQTSLLPEAGRYRPLEQQVAQRQTELQQARDAERVARTQVEVQQDVVGSTVADLYRAGPTERFPVLALSVHDAGAPSDVLFRQALADRADRTVEGAVVRAERTGTALTAATTRAAPAQGAPPAAAHAPAARRSAAGVLDTVRDKIGDLSPAVTAQLAALGAIPTAGAQQDRNSHAVARWQDYLGRPARARLRPPPAGAVRRPT